MARVSVILGHPAPDSLNAAIARTCAESLAALGHEVAFHDLAAEGFDPALPAAEIARGADLPALVARHCEEIARADGIVIVHPDWWSMPPAILKGWIDRVLRVDVAYRFLPGDGGEGVPEGLLKARCAVVYNTSNTPAARERTVFGDPLEGLWKTAILDLCGVRDFHRRMFSVVCTSDEATRRGWLDTVAQDMQRLFPSQN